MSRSRSPSRSSSPAASPNDSSANSRCNPFSIDYILSEAAAATEVEQRLQRNQLGPALAANQDTSSRQQQDHRAPCDDSLVEQSDMHIQISQERAKLMAQLQSMAAISPTASDQNNASSSPMRQQHKPEAFQRLLAEASQDKNMATTAKQLAGPSQQQQQQEATTAPTAVAAAAQMANPNLLYFMACMLLQQQQQQQQRQQNLVCQQQLVQATAAAASRSPQIDQQQGQARHQQLPSPAVDSLALLTRMTSSSTPAVLQRPMASLQQQHQNHQTPFRGASASHPIRRQPYPVAAAAADRGASNARTSQYNNQALANASAFHPDQFRRQMVGVNQPPMQQPALQPRLAANQLGSFASMMSSMHQALDTMAANRANTLMAAAASHQHHDQHPHQHPHLLGGSLHKAGSRPALPMQAATVGPQRKGQHHHQQLGSAPASSGVSANLNTARHQQHQAKATSCASSEPGSKLLDNLKPAHSYIGLIAMCILSTPDKRMVLNDIYQFILDHYPYYRNRGSGWRNSVRHNLSLNECFQKDIRAPNGKGHYWRIHPANMADFMNGDFRRRRAQRQVRRYNNMEVPSDESDDESMEDAARPPLPEHFKRSLEMHRQLEMIYSKAE